MNGSSIAFLALLVFLLVPDFRYSVILFLESLSAIVLIALLLVAAKFA